MEPLVGHLALDGAHLPDPLAGFERGRAESSPFVRVRAPTIERQGALTVALTGRPWIDGAQRDPSAIARHILAWYRDHGRAFLPKLHGSFALAIVDSRSGDALLGIDRMGIETLAWRTTPTLLSFATSAATVAAATGKPTLNHQALLDFMFGHMVAAPDTVYAGVHKLLAGNCLVIESGRPTIERYWQPDFRRVPTNVAALCSEVLPTIARAIDRCDPGPETGTFLSGGLDSSTVTGLLAKRTGRSATAFSVGFGVDEFNELAYAKIASAAFGCGHVIYEVVPQDIVELLPKIAAAYDEPFGNSSTVPTFCCARLAKAHGVRHLLAGDGGDELFGGNSRYVRHKIFAIYERLPRWLRAMVLDPLAAKIDPETSPLPLRKLSSYVRQARVPLPERFESWDLMYREGAEAVFDPGFLDRVDTAHSLRKGRELWDSCPSADLLDRMLWYDWQITLADNDLRKVSRMCEFGGIRVSYPMLDDEVVALSMQVPSKAKISGTELRTFFKRSVQGFVPNEIIKKEKHGFSLPFGQWLKTHRPLQELVYGSLDSLRARHIVSAAFIDRVIAEHRVGHASYYGYAIWDMVVLEQWLQSRRP